jgi:hypothetical protein
MTNCSPVPGALPAKDLLDAERLSPDGLVPSDRQQVTRCDGLELKNTSKTHKLRERIPTSMYHFLVLIGGYFVNYKQTYIYIYMYIYIYT